MLFMLDSYKTYSGQKYDGIGKQCQVFFALFAYILLLVLQ